MVLKLRNASLNDAAYLLDLRNERTTREASLSTEIINLSDHLKWLSDSINSSNRKIFIGEVDGDSVGSIRADVIKNGWYLSWAVSPKFRGKGFSQHMLKEVISILKGYPLYIKIKFSNTASIIIAERSGFYLTDKIGDILHYFRPADL